MLIGTALVLLMQGGFLLLEAGMTRAKNYINVAVKNLADLGLAIILFWLVGFGLMFGDSAGGVVGLSMFALDLPLVDTDTSVLFLFQVVFAGTTVTILSGSIAERTSFTGYIGIVVAMAVVYPLYGHWVWGGGFLSGWGFVDFAGSTVVHSIGGWAALAAMIVIGPRHGRFDGEGESSIRPSNLPLAMTGGVLLWFGWIGFNGASTLAFDETVPGVIAITMIGGAFGLVTAMFVEWRRHGYPTPASPLNGALAGLVAVTAGAHALNTISAAVVGAVGALVALRVERLLEERHIDDAVGAVPVHLGAGMWGTLAVGLFGRADVLDTGLNRVEQTLIQGAGIGIGAVWGFGLCLVIFRLIDTRVPLRVPLEDEIEGLNVAEHREPTALIDLLQHMAHQARTGAITDPIESESFTEVGQIAEQFNGLTAQLRTMAQLAEKIADGRLDIQVTPRSDEDTFGLAFRRMTQDLRSTVGQITGTADGLQRSMANLGQLTATIEDGVSVQQEGVSQGEVAFAEVRSLIDSLVHEVGDLGAQTSTALESLVGSMDQSRLGHPGRRATDAAEDGAADLRAAVDAIKGSADEISSIVDVVRSIAGTTTLLSLNAYIEAEHAGGERGAAFAVVAEEVRELANETVESVRQIDGKIQALQNNASTAVRLVEGVVGEVDELNHTFEGLSGGVNATADALQEQALAAQGAIRTISEVSSGNAETAAGFRSLARDVEAGIEDVGNQLSRFRT
ncbi:MAG: ammonium transporter [Actinomycetota bacterium]